MGINAVFTYGSLMCGDIFAAVASLRLTPCPAELDDYARHPVVGTDDPGIRPHAGSAVSGVLYRDLPPCALERLDRFEGEEYLRERLSVRLDDGSRMDAWAYVVAPAQHHRLATGPWDFEHFVREGKARFLRRHPPTPL